MKTRTRSCTFKLSNYWKIYFNPDIFNIIRETKPGKGGEIQITDALLTQAKNGMVLAFKFDGQRFDCGSIDGFVKLQTIFITNQQKRKR